MNDVFEHHNLSSVAVLDADQDIHITYGQLLERVTRAADCLRRELGQGLVFQVALNTVESIVLYLACLHLGCPVCLLEPTKTDRLNMLVGAYAPDALFLPKETKPLMGAWREVPLPEVTYRMDLRDPDRPSRSLHPDLALLLTTSGSTGSPKMVRLSRNNLLANAESIVSYLGIQPGERSIQSLPIHYSYGLSLVNSHLSAGATVVLTRHSFLRPEFWGAFDKTACTSFAGVPYIYETLHRLHFDARRHPSLRTMTQAGGRLSCDVIKSFYELTSSARCRFFVMYGQTEATARISYVPYERLSEKIGSIGIPIPKGHISLRTLEDPDVQELIYSGPNVMMGYADSAEDLAAGDELRGVLQTGDLARLDGDGFFYLTGRLKRFAKLFGRRISLEDLENDLEESYPIHAAVKEREGELLVYAAVLGQMELDAVARYLAQRLSVPPKCITVNEIAEIPLTPSGKKDYKRLPS